MEQFGSLSLEDEIDQKARDEDLMSISRLTISDNTFNVSPQLMSRYMPHFPALPSPLRNSFSYVEGDQMEIDECEDGLSIRNENNDTNPSTDDRQEPRVTFVMPDVRHGREKKSSAVREEVEEVEEDDRIDPKEHNEQREDGTSSTAVIKALLSPTSLGVAAATKIDGIPLEPPREIGHLNDSVEYTSGHQSQQIDIDTIKHDLRARSKNQPIHVSINNHHHYYPSYAEPQMLQPPLHEDNRYRLPVPWSAESHPTSRGSYAFMSYLQLFLNAITVTAIVTVIISFFKTLKADIKSTWEHRRLELAYESSRCQIQYLANKCNQGGRPALQAQCQSWEQCMNRDNDIFFRARSTLSAQLFGEVINSFIEPIGWKALLVIWMGIAVWLFCSNFLLGFARAKSYYGEPSQRIMTSSSLMHRQEPEFLGQSREHIKEDSQNTLIDLPRAHR